jgi:RNA recognition motif-containing protein
MNDKFTENLSNALKEIEIGIDNNYIMKMQEINEKREEVLKNKEKRRREMAEHRYIEAMLQKQHIDYTTKKRRLTSYSSNILNDKKPNNDNENKNKSSSHTVVVENLASMTNEYSISAICQTVGPIKSCSIELANGKRKAIAKFVSRGDAALFQRRFHNFKLDSNVIRTRIV